MTQVVSGGRQKLHEHTKKKKKKGGVGGRWGVGWGVYCQTPRLHNQSPVMLSLIVWVSAAAHQPG